VTSKLTDCLRTGKVSAIFPDRGTAEVTFEDRGDVVSRELFIVVPFTLKDKAYYMPAIQERVTCYFDPGAPSVGYIFGSFYADTRKPPYSDANKTYVEFEDKTLVEYDKKLHKLTVKVPEAGDLSVDIVATGPISVKSDAPITIESAVSISLKAPQVAIEGNITHTGNMTTSGTHTDSIGTHV
jgi:phage baseplate assembly protein V